MPDNYWAHPRPDGKWGSKKEGAPKDSRIFKTQEEAWGYSKNHAKQCGGEAFLQNKHGRIGIQRTYNQNNA